MIRRIPLLLALLPMVGCKANDPNGVYLVLIDDVVGDEEVPDTVEHNYVGAQEPVDDTTSDWTEESTLDESQAAWFMEIFDVQDVEGDFVKTMVVNDTVLVGTQQEDDSWLFTWTNSDDNTDTETHTAGYTFSRHDVLDLVWSIDVLLEDGVGTGTFRLDFTGTTSWDESDTWDPLDNGILTGQTPVYNYLEMTADSTPAFNDSVDTDCSGTPCHLSDTQVGGQTAALQIRRTDLTADEFEAVYGSGQDAGLPNN